MFTYIYHEKQRKMSSYFSLATVFIEDQGAQFFIEAFPEAVFSVGTARVFPCLLKATPGLAGFPWRG